MISVAVPGPGSVGGPDPAWHRADRTRRGHSPFVARPADLAAAVGKCAGVTIDRVASRLIECTEKWGVGMASDDPIDIVTRFCAAWKTGDTGALIDFFTDDATYQNMMDEPWHGKERIHQVFKSFYTFTRSIDFTIRSIAASGNTVLAERIDICTTTEDVTAHLPLVGVFEVRDGRIAAWRDYYDNAQFRRMLQHPPRDPGHPDDSDLGVARTSSTDRGLVQD